MGLRPTPLYSPPRYARRTGILERVPPPPAGTAPEDGFRRTPGRGPPRTPGLRSTASLPSTCRPCASGPKLASLPDPRAATRWASTDP